MDFGDILNKWEQQSTGSANSRHKSGEDNRQDTESPVDVWMRANGVYDKDSDHTGKKQNAAEQRQRLRRKKPDAEIDIHGLTRDEAWEALERFFTESKEKKRDKVLIIHGKGIHSGGEAVLKRMVREFIERCSFAGESGQGKPAAGGEGATWVLLKHHDTKASAE